MYREAVAHLQPILKRKLRPTPMPLSADFIYQPIICFITVIPFSKIKDQSNDLFN